MRAEEFTIDNQRVYESKNEYCTVKKIKISTKTRQELCKSLNLLGGFRKQKESKAMRAYSLAVLNRSEAPPEIDSTRKRDHCFSTSLKLSKERLKEVRSIDATLKDYVTPF